MKTGLRAMRVTTGGPIIQSCPKTVGESILSVSRQEQMYVTGIKQVRVVEVNNQ